VVGVAVVVLLGLVVVDDASALAALGDAVDDGEAVP